LSNEWKYVGLDFETTGLSRSKDEPIQIGIVEYDSHGNLLREYQSLLRPVQKIWEIKTIVNFMTGISLKDLEDAPKLEEVIETVLSFFDDKTFVIWHSVDFDVHFLQKYFPQVKIAGTLDTYEWSQQFVHYASSYALEVLVETLIQKDKDFEKYLKQQKLLFLKEDCDENFYHDALYDAKLSSVLFFYFVKYIKKLASKYPVLHHFVKQKNTVFSKIFDFLAGTYNPVIELPVLEKLMPRNLTLQNTENSLSLDKFESGKRYYVGNVKLSELLKNLLWSKQIILAFSHKQKLDLAKKIFHNIGIRNIGFARWDQIINFKVFHRFLQKWTFDEREVFFVLKYVSHLHQGYGVLDLRTTWDYQLFNLLRDTKKSEKYPIVLATHSWLFSLLEQKDHIYHDYSIVFFDVEAWYKNYNSYLSRPCDLYFVLTFLEGLLYIYNVRDQIIPWKYKKLVSYLQDFINFFQVFIWTLFIDTKKLFDGRSENRISYNPILDNSDFRLTNELWPKMMVHVKKIEWLLLKSDLNQLNKHIETINIALDSVMLISKRTHNNSDTYFVYQENTQFTNWMDFVEIFDKNHVMFLSNFVETYNYLVTGVDFVFADKFISVHQMNRLVVYLKKLVDDLEQKETIFVLSSQKYQSQEIFGILHKDDIHNKVLLIAENITWWVGKCIFKAKQNGGKILIGSYNFLLWLISHQVTIDKVVDFNIKWKQEDYLLQDLKRYLFW